MTAQFKCVFSANNQRITQIVTANSAMEAKKIIESGRLGELTNIRTQYLQSWSADPSSP